MLILSVSSCKETLQDINTNPELLGQTNPVYVFTGAIGNWNNSSRSDLTGKYNGVMQLMQYIVSSGGAQEGIYANVLKQNNPSPSVPYYGKFFHEQIGLRLRYLVDNVIAFHPEKEKFSDLAAIAKMLEAYEAWLIFDVYGAAPYKEAFKVNEGIRQPKYDYYQDVYKEFDSIVKASVDELSATNKVPQAELGNNDFFYKGDISKWIRFGNTLRIKMAQRLEKADADHYSTVITEALSHSGGIISTNDQSCIFYHGNEHNNNTDDMQILTYQYCVSNSFVNYLNANNDPRLKLLVRPNGFGKLNNNEINDEVIDTLTKYVPDYKTIYPFWAERYNGISSNLDSSSSNLQRSYFTIPITGDRNVSIRIKSQIESRFFVKNGGQIGTQVTSRDKEDDKYNYDLNSIKLFSPILTYPETCFMMAEIALKKGAAMGGKSAEQWYFEGVRSSLEIYQKWGERIKVPSAMDNTSDNYAPITNDAIASYLEQSNHLPVTLEKIISQAWVNYFMQPEEAWATWKRTGLPAFKDNGAPSGKVAFMETIKSDESFLIPRRSILPRPNSLNEPNYNMAVEKLTSTPGYGPLVGYTQGRIWWDKE